MSNINGASIPKSEEAKTQTPRPPSPSRVYLQHQSSPIRPIDWAKFTFREFLVCYLVTLFPILFTYAIAFHFTQHHAWASGIAGTLLWVFSIPTYAMVKSKNAWFPMILQCEMSALCFIFYANLMGRYIALLLAVLHLVIFGLKIEDRLGTEAGLRKEEIYCMGVFLFDALKEQRTH